MSKVSIYETSWLNLVFEGKNKAYGAYQLRQESPRTTLFAFFFGLLFIGALAGGGMLLSSFGTPPETPIVIDEPIIIIDYVAPPATVKPVVPPGAKKATPNTEVTDAKDLTDPVITNAENADDIKTKNDPPAATDPGPEGTDTGTKGTTNIGTTTATSGTGDKPTNPDVVVTTVNVDVMPEYPGGITKFYTYVGNNFEKPEIEETVTVFMSFVIERDGTMTDIKVLRNPGYGLDKEAVRVLKSLKTKWKPGVKNGQAVRVLYTLPIKVTRSN